MDELEKERRRLREANARFGDALAATLDAEQLRRVIVESAVEATTRTEASSSPRTARSSRPATSAPAAQRLDFELKAGLRSFGRLLLVGEEFDVEERMIAASLAGQAVVALENARLHQMVERQALVDGLTGLANRRQADASLATELTRAERLGRPGRHSSWPTSTTSSSSTTGTGTRPETSSCATSRRRCARRSARSTPRRAGEGRSSR